MKLVITLQNRLNAVKAAAFSCLKKKEGQNTVEYIIMLTVVVGVALLVGGLVKGMMPDVFEKVKSKILGSVDSIE